MTPPRHGGLTPAGFQARRLHRPLTAAQARQIWADLVAEAKRVAQLVQADAEAPGVAAVTAQLQKLSSARTPRTFPVPEAAATITAECFQGMVRALSYAVLPHRRQFYAYALGVLAETLDALIHDDRALQADRWRGQAGGDR